MCLKNSNKLNSGLFPGISTQCNTLLQKFPDPVNETLRLVTTLYGRDEASWLNLNSFSAPLHVNHLCYFTRPADLWFVFFCSFSFIKHSGQRLFFCLYSCMLAGLLTVPGCPPTQIQNWRQKTEMGVKLMRHEDTKARQAVFSEPYNTVVLSHL